MPWKPNTTVAAVIKERDRYLIVEELIDGQLRLNQPAGHLEPGESLVDAVKRETLEETGWTFEPQALVNIQLWQRDPALTILRFTFCGQTVKHHPDRPHDNDIVATHWLTREQLENEQLRLRSPLVLRSIDDYLRGERYPLELIHTTLEKSSPE